MSAPSFRFLSAPSALIGAPAGWAATMLEAGDLALLAVEGLEAVDRVAHALSRPMVQILRTEMTPEAQDATVIAYAENVALVWVAPAFSPAASDWATRRGAMTLLVETDAPLSEAERRRIDRFVASLGRQSE